MKILWTLLAVSLPFFSVQWGRIDNESIKVHMAPPMLVMGIILAIGILLILSWKGIIPPFFKGNQKYQTLFMLLIYLLFTWYLISALRPGEIKFAVRDLTKVGSGVICMFSVLAFFPRDKEFLERFWIITMYCSATLMCLLIYKYAIVFQVTTLGTDLNAYSIVGKNQLASYLVWIIPYSIMYFWGAKKKLFAAIPLVILLIAWIYSGSRGGWAGVLAGLVFIIPLIGRTYGIKKIAILLLGAAVIVGLSFLLLKNVLFRGEEQLGFLLRLLDIFDPNALPNTDSVGAREHLMKEAWEIFLSAPVIGVGLTQTGVLMDLSVHNSYISMLTDLGLIGLGLFFGVILCIFAIILHVPVFSSKLKVPWIYFGSVAAFVGSLVFMNTMDRISVTTQFWVLTGFTLLAGDMQKEEENGLVGNKS